MSIYGYCPKCGAPVKGRERAMNGNDICENGHKYPSRETLREKPATKLWLCGQVTGPDDQWEFQGIFSTEERAVKACFEESYFVAPVTLDKELPRERSEFPGAYYPLANAEDEK